MWAPLGRKKQLPGLTSLKKNSSWSCVNTCSQGIYDQKTFLYQFPNLDFVLPSRCVCGPSSSPPPVPSPTPAFPSHLEMPRLGDEPIPRTPSDWPGSRSTAGMTRMEERMGEKRERENNEWTKRWQQRRGVWGPARRGRLTAHLMDGSVFVRAENRKLASDKHNILLLIFPAWLPWNPSLPSDRLVMEIPPSPWINKDEGKFH